MTIEKSIKEKRLKKPLLNLLGLLGIVSLISYTAMDGIEQRFTTRIGGFRMKALIGKVAFIQFYRH